MSGDEESLRAVLDQGEAERLALKGELVSRAHAFTTGTQKAVDLLTIKRSEIAAIEREIRLQDAREDGAERTLDVARRLASRGYVSRLQLRQYEDAALDAGQKTAALQQRKAELEGDAEEFREEPARLRDEFVTARSGIDQKLSQLEQRRTQAQAAWRFVIRAPVDGQIADLQVRAGDVTRQNQFQVAVVPTSSNLEAELFVPSQGVGPLRVGQLVHVHYDAYPYQLYGYGLASIASVSKTSIPSSDAPVHLSTDEPVYRVVLELARPSLLSKGRHTIELRAGMTLRADIVLDREPLWRGLIKLFNPDPE
jgi:membrane fusion protein